MSFEPKAHDYSRFNEQIGRRAKTKADYEKAKASLDEYLSLYGYDSAAEYTQTLSQMKKQLAEAGFAKENMDSALQKKTQFENDNDMDKLLAPNECPYTLDELNEMISKVEGSLDEIRASLVQYGRQMDDLQEQLDMRDEKEQEYRNCKQIQAEEKHKYEILGLTSDYLTRAREQFTARYMGAYFQWLSEVLWYPDRKYRQRLAGGCQYFNKDEGAGAASRCENHVGRLQGPDRHMYAFCACGCDVSGREAVPHT